MHLADKQGNTKYDLLTKFSQKTGKTHPDLIFPDLDEMAMYLWEWFMELQRGRQYGMSGALPLSYSDMKAWAELTGKQPQHWEIDVLKQIDII